RVHLDCLTPIRDSISEARREAPVDLGGPAGARKAECAVRAPGAVVSPQHDALQRGAKVDDADTFRDPARGHLLELGRPDLAVVGTVEVLCETFTGGGVPHSRDI